MNKRVCHSSLAISCALALVISFATEGYAQFDKMGLNTDWKKGSIVLEDNTKLEGLIQFNTKLGMIKVKKHPESVEESFAETSILTMQLYDEDVAAWRNFAVFNVKEVETGRQVALLFEILMEFKDFALLSRVERARIAARRHESYLGDVSAARVGYEQFEHLCLVDKDGTATTVLSVSEFEANKLSMGIKVKPIVDKRALEKYLAEDWDDFQALVKSHDLNLKKRDEFIKAFEYYKETL